MNTLTCLYNPRLYEGYVKNKDINSNMTHDKEEISSNTEYLQVSVGG